MIRLSLGQWILGRAFGGGVTGEIGSRAVTYLGHELRHAIDRPDLVVTSMRLQPGESVTVTTRPRLSRKERRLTRKQASLLAVYKRETTPTRSQKRLARKLRSAQRRLDRTRPSSRRYEQRAMKESRLGSRFDRAMRPSKKQIVATASLARVSRELETLRARSMAEARAKRSRV